MMKGFHKAVILILGLTLLTGCGLFGNKSATAKGQSSTSSKVTETNQVLGNYAGTHKGDGTAKDPTYRYSINFDKHGHFTQDIISSQGYAGRFTQTGSYKVDAKSKDVTIRIEQVTEEMFSSDDILKAGGAPVSISVRSSLDGSSTKLTAAEDHPIQLLNRKEYLLGTVNNVKLYPTKETTVSYIKHRDTELKKYKETFNRFSGKTFNSASGTASNSLAFQGNQFIWQYSNGKSNQPEVAVIQGTYVVDLSNNQIILTVTIESPTYQGTDISKGTYRSTGASLFGTKEIKLRITDNDHLQVLTGLSVNVSSFQIEATGDQYSTILEQWGVDHLKQSWHESKSQSVTDIFPTVQDFEKWIVGWWEKSGIDTNATEDNPANHITSSGTDEQLGISGTGQTIDAVYTVYWADTMVGQENMAPAHLYAITADGKIYTGNGSAMLNDTWTARYRSDFLVN
ncbi:hypothetical protein [Schleiferilactobacillus perolens]|uniref:Lipoprotein n=1 Tax=Schleiferilactobacillus perolens DSM 12744 TaxID=1423792 RepID=A0A0R1MIQ1_9LACO|nr:hypothetical protein [Schleiferilactobacillus perolens]KRL07879.1 hypothetical protein FD09_GL002020 [Schleiferilactobacillus perolens DSM 12744]